MFAQNNCSELEELIRILYSWDQSGINTDLKDNEYLITMIDHLASEDHRMIEIDIRRLQEYLTRNESPFVGMRASISMMIAYAFCKLEDQPQTLYYAEFATKQFLWYPNLWYEALVTWFLGIVYRNHGNFEEAKDTLLKAKELLEKHAIDAQRRSNDKTQDLCHKYIYRIEQSINNLPPTTVTHLQPENNESKSLPNRLLDKLKRPFSSKNTEPAEPPLKQNQFTGRSHRNKTPLLTRENQASSVTSSPTPGSSLFHIIIPVDIQALTNPQITSRMLDANLFDRLKEYSHWKTDRISTKEGGQVKNPQSAKQLKSIIRPFPIRGRATAGSKGEVTFEEPEWANSVTEDHQIEFFGIEHIVYSTKEKDTQITIVEGDVYEWLKIDGESMNLARPIPIENQDYVLFHKINDIESCENKIVIATQPGPDEHYSLLIVKRLIALDPKSKKSSNAKKKYYLHSESSQDEYKDDIEFTEKNQLIGKVIAIAKPMK